MQKLKFTSSDIAQDLINKYGKKLDGAILYDGYSRIDGAPIWAIITGIKGTSKNDKTGPMAQVKILLKDIAPTEAIKTGADYSICGDCKFRPYFDNVKNKMIRDCYVNLLFSPNQTWKSAHNGNYPILTPEEVGALLNFYNVGVRIGEYGDPSAINVSIWQRLISSANTFNTSYSHQWNTSWFQPEFFQFGMASIDDTLTEEMFRELHGQTPRAYRVAKDYETIKPDEIKCPSKNSSGDRVVTCAQCKLCSGYGRIGAKNIVIVEGS